SHWLMINAVAAPADERFWKVNAADLASLPPVLARRVARLLLKRAAGDPRGTPQAAVLELLRMSRGGATGVERRLPGGIFSAVEGLELVIRGGDATARAPALPATFSMTLRVPGGCELPGNTGALTARVVPRGDLLQIPDGERLVALDA